MKQKSSRTEWQAEQTAVARARQALESPADLSGGTALGRLVAAGELRSFGLAVPQPSKPALSQTTILETVASQDFSPLEAAAAQILMLAPDLGSETDVTRDSACAQVLAAFKGRHELELVLIGAEALLGHAPPLTPSQLEYALEFEQLIRPALWQLVPMNELRQDRASRLAPHERARFWWWSEGMQITRTALDAMAVTAELLEAFPAARDHFEQLVGVGGLWAAAASAPSNRASKIVCLRDWVARHRSAASEDRPVEVAIAVGFDSGERALLVRDDFELSWSAPDTLYLDLIAERRREASPTLLLQARAIAGELVPECEERFRFKLDPAALASTSACLLIPFVSGELRLDLVGGDG